MNPKQKQPSWKEDINNHKREIGTVIVSVIIAFLLYTVFFWQDFPVLDNSQDPQFGAEDAKVEFVVFIEFGRMSAAAFFQRIVIPLDEKYGHDTKFIFKTIPRDNICNPESNAEMGTCNISEAIHCSQEQGKFYEYANFLTEKILEEMMYKDFNSEIINIKDEPLINISGHAGLDSQQFSHCLSTGRMLDAIVRNAIDIKLYNLSKTPSIFINNEEFEIKKGRTIKNLRVELDEKIKSIIGD